MRIRSQGKGPQGEPRCARRPSTLLGVPLLPQLLELWSACAALLSALMLHGASLLSACEFLPACGAAGRRRRCRVTKAHQRDAPLFCEHARHVALRVCAESGRKRRRGWGGEVGGGAGAVASVLCRIVVRGRPIVDSISSCQCPLLSSSSSCSFIIIILIINPSAAAVLAAAAAGCSRAALSCLALSSCALGGRGRI